MAPQLLPQRLATLPVRPPALGSPAQSELRRPSWGARPLWPAATVACVLPAAVACAKARKRRFLFHSSTVPVSYAEAVLCGSFLSSRRGFGSNCQVTPTAVQRAGAVAEAQPEVAVDEELEQRVRLLRSVGEECQTEAELRNLLLKKPNFVLYDGFEPSGRMHIAQGIFKSILVNKCTKAGGTFIFWVADWFALMNDKMGGDIEKIKTVGKYLIEVWKASGMDMSKVIFLWSSEEISKKAEEYWGQALDIARRSTLARVKKCCQIMGRKEDSLTAAQILYPIMQCTDIFFLKADVCQLGVDQRKVNMLARDYCESAGRKLKPVILSHHMLYGLKKGQSKMSKSDPDSAIFMEDKAEDVTRKILNAYCPTAPEDATPASDEESMSLVQDDLKNPLLDYVQYLLLSQEGKTFEVSGRHFSHFQEFKEAYLAGEVPEVAFKESLIREVNILVEPVRQHFANNPEAGELLAKVTQWRRETLTPTSSLVRLQLAVESSQPLFVVFAPRPSESVSLGAVWQLLQRLRHAPEGHQPVLWLEDWAARCLGCAGGTPECVKAYYHLLLHGLKTVDPDVMSKVKVMWQGEAILSGPSDYWMSVINAGRWASVEAVGKALPQGEKLEQASQVVSSLMHMGDVLALLGGGRKGSISTDTLHSPGHKLAVDYFSKLGLEAPELVISDLPSLRLREEGEGLEADATLLVTDSEQDLNRKIKKAFCEPGNADFCPPLDWAEALLPLKKEFVVGRKAENGGELRYTEPAPMREDFRSGALHPGDLKPALSEVLKSLMAGVRSGVQASNDLKQAQKKLEAYAKSLQKGKK